MRIPKRHVSEWPKKQLWNYAYRALERESLSGEKERYELADSLMDKMNNHTITRAELEYWANHEVEFRQLVQ